MYKIWTWLLLGVLILDQGFGEERGQHDDLRHIRHHKKRQTHGNGDVLPEPGSGHCGLSSSDRIFGGEATAIDEFPWMALIEFTFDSGQKIFGCGGSLINERYVITAAHCISYSNPILTSVRLGEWNKATTIDCNEADDCADPPVNIPIEKMIVHKYYSESDANQNHDIALLRLAKPVNYTYFIKPVCLPTTDYLKAQTNYSYINYTVSGWGRTETKYLSDVKLKVNVMGTTKALCNRVYSRINLTISDHQICAGGEKGKDSCQGDSGGPLTQYVRIGRQNPFDYLAGIVSYGPRDCGSKGWPGVYTRVASYISWIKSKLKP
jgi:secreted trypsin-like serine protease